MGLGLVFACVSHDEIPLNNQRAAVKDCHALYSVLLAIADIILGIGSAAMYLLLSYA